jgi:hypothetical protein
LFKTGNLVGWNGEGADWGKKIYGRYSEPAGSLFVRVRIDGFRELLEQLM